MVSALSRLRQWLRCRAYRRHAAVLVLCRTALLGAFLAGCGVTEIGVPLPNEQAATGLEEQGYELVARFVHMTDVHVTDEESPARLAIFAGVSPSAWRPQEAYSTQLLDGIIRATNALHAAGLHIDFVLEGGDAVDNAQSNELNWFLDVIDGRAVNPLSGIDDRPVAERGSPDLDPYAPLQPEGLYRHGVHGDLPTIDWYAAVGNHDHLAVGVFPILRDLAGRLVAPLPGPLRIGLFLPTVLYPAGTLAYGLVTPAEPGPPPELGRPTRVTPNPDRRYLTLDESVERYRDTLTTPTGHGFPPNGHTWYSVSPVPGMRVIVLNTSDLRIALPGGIYDGGAVSAEQVEFLRAELQRSVDQNELVIVLSHHPSSFLSRFAGSAISGQDLIDLLNQYPNVVAHLGGHSHRQRVWDRGNYVEIETSAVIDAPQEARLIEVWRRGAEVALRYEVFSHLYTGRPFEELRITGDDPYRAMRARALELAQEHSDLFHLLPVQKRALAPTFELRLPLEEPLRETDRNGMFQMQVSH